MTFDDDEGPAAWNQAISIGDIDNFEDDDFEFKFRGFGSGYLGPPLRSFGFFLHDNAKNASESYTVHGTDGRILGVAPGSEIPDSSGMTNFVGVFTREHDPSIDRVEFDEADDGDDIAILNFRFPVDTVTDSDSDGVPGCSDCDDGNPNCTTDCTDADSDGFCVTTDCDDADPNNWVSCGTCIDGDGDTHYTDCDAYMTISGPDCDDSVASCATDCTDADSDGTRACEGDCDDGNPNCITDCTDADSDGFCVTTDCGDADPNNWASCGTCIDGDGDTHYTGCDAYMTISGPDCDDSVASCTTDCTDADSDGYCVGFDCSDGDPNNWVSCTTCVDADSDAYFDGCDAYSTINGPDCDDGDPNCTYDCTDADSDGYCVGVDCDDSKSFCTTDCTDADSDGYCVPHDCDDSKPNCTTDCTDADSDGYCVPHDCDDSKPFCTTDCTDGDSDGLRACDGDCDDADSSVYPGASQVCDGVNNDCDDPLWPALGPSSWDGSEISTTADGAGSVFAADLDSDGDLDVLSASVADDKIAWYENADADSDGEPDASWTARPITTSADGAISVFAADVDGDGDPDVLSASELDDKVAWYENADTNSDGVPDASWTARTITTGADRARSVYAADVDGDGDLDALSASFDDDTIAWYENADLDSDGVPDASWTARPITTSADGAISVFAGDVDSDGDLDVLSASYYGNEIAWYENADAKQRRGAGVDGAHDHDRDQPGPLRLRGGRGWRWGPGRAVGLLQRRHDRVVRECRPGQRRRARRLVDGAGQSRPAPTGRFRCSPGMWTATGTWTSCPPLTTATRSPGTRTRMRTATGCRSGRRVRSRPQPPARTASTWRMSTATGTWTPCPPLTTATRSPGTCRERWKTTRTGTAWRSATAIATTASRTARRTARTRTATVTACRTTATTASRIARRTARTRTATAIV